MTTDAAQFAERWLQVLSGSEFDAWPELVAEDVAMRFPFAPPGIPTECRGRAVCLEIIRAFFAGIERFAWRDVSVHAAREPDLVFVTARSEATLHNGRAYANEYCLVIRLREGRLSEYREYFNPLPAIAAFS
jgi:ketosteroid isomerase-like protein